MNNYKYMNEHELYIELQNEIDHLYARYDEMIEKHLYEEAVKVSREIADFTEVIKECGYNLSDETHLVY